MKLDSWKASPRVWAWPAARGSAAVIGLQMDAGEERLERLARDVPGAGGVDRGGADRVGAAAAVEVVEELRAPADQRRRVGLVEVVDQLVGVAGQAVERVHVRPLGGRQQQGGEVVRLAVAGVQPPAGLVGRPQPRVGDPRRIQLPPPHADRPPTSVGPVIAISFTISASTPLSRSAGSVSWK